jgi:hypothetical protein
LASNLPAVAALLCVSTFQRSLRCSSEKSPAGLVATCEWSVGLAPRRAEYRRALQSTLSTSGRCERVPLPISMRCPTTRRPTEEARRGEGGEGRRGEASGGEGRGGERRGAEGRGAEGRGGEGRYLGCARRQRDQYPIRAQSCTCASLSCRRTFHRSQIALLRVSARMLQHTHTAVETRRT